MQRREHRYISVVDFTDIVHQCQTQRLQQVDVEIQLAGNREQSYRQMPAVLGGVLAAGEVAEVALARYQLELLQLGEEIDDVADLVPVIHSQYFHILKFA